MSSTLYIQSILLIVTAIILSKVLSSRGTHAGNAWQKIGVIMLSIVMIISIIFPSLVTDIAHLVGVGRGTDLVVYTLFVAFIFYVINQYLKGQEQRDVTYRLARKVALLDARNRYRDLFK